MQMVYCEDGKVGFVSSEDEARKETKVESRAKRRRFSAQEKKRLLDEAEKMTKHGELSAFLRREGIYSSHLSNWRKQGVEVKKRGPAKRDPALVGRVAELERDNRRLLARATKAEALVELQKKVSELLGIAFPGNDETNS